MAFAFSFSLPIPGLTNPFSAASHQSSSAPEHKQAALDARNDMHGNTGTGEPRRRAPSPSLLPPLSRKRGWVPSCSELSRPSAVPTSTIGYLDTPARYREMMAASDEDAIEEMVADLPPPKRRRTLAGSIVSTALSAALIGTAVGLTVYRLWRNRGKQPELLPPPPYEQGEWLPPKPEPTPVSSPIPVTQVTPPTPRSRRTRHVAGRRTTPRHRKTISRAAHASTASFGSTSASRLPIPPEFNFNASAQDMDGDVDADDDQMSWIGDRLASLIAEGQRALGKEVVVMSESQEDEDDDGADDWVEDDDEDNRSRTTRRSDKHPYHGGLPPYSASRHASPFASPRSDTFDLNHSYGGSMALSPYARSLPSSPRKSGFLHREASVESETFTSRSYQEDESTWQTPELREAMERARQRYMRDHA